MKRQCGRNGNFWTRPCRNLATIRMQCSPMNRFSGTRSCRLTLIPGCSIPSILCREVEERYRDGDVPLNAAEGFIRQIIGWREYVRGIYWREGPDYADRNFLEAEARPAGILLHRRNRRCTACHRPSARHWILAYAHHIQRLMITGNFALIAGIDPHPGA